MARRSTGRKRRSGSGGDNDGHRYVDDQKMKDIGDNDKDENENARNQDPKAISSGSSYSSSASSSSDKIDAASTSIQAEKLEEDDENVDDVRNSNEMEKEMAAKKKKTSTSLLTTSTSLAKMNHGSSRMFAPYRTVGIVADGPFHLIPHQNSSTAMLATAIGDRFHLVQCDKLTPVLVSRAVPGLLTSSSDTTTTTGKTKDGTGSQSIRQIVTDATLSISVVAHGFGQTSSGGRTTRVTLFQRTRPLKTLELEDDLLSPGSTCRRSEEDEDNDDNDWSIVDMLHLGKIKMTMTGEKQDKKENAALIAVIVSKGRDFSDDEYYRDGVPIVGSDRDDDGNESGSSSGRDSSDDEEEDEHPMKKSSSCACRGQVVLLIASRTTLNVHKRILLDKVDTFSPRVAIHPPTYVNKIVIGGSCTTTGRDAMILINIRTGTMIHEFKCLSSESKETHFSKKQRSEITSMEASPAIDTIAVGTSRGMVHLINTRYDKLLFSLQHRPKTGSKQQKNQSSSGDGRAVRITSMSFRTDGSALKYGIAPLAVGRSDGTITIWDLSPPESNEGSKKGDAESALRRHQDVGRTILCEMERVHYPGGVCKLQYMPQEPLLVSTGTKSNSILMHIFDNPDYSARILRQRRGHTSPPQCIRYLHAGAGVGGGVLANMSDGTDAHACQILSSGSADRTLRRFSTVRSVLDREFSQGKGLEKRARELGFNSKAELLLPPVTALSACEMRSRDWGDLVTIHEKHAFAYVWSTKSGSQSGPVLRQDEWNVSAMKKPPPTTAHATSVTLSTCGNYALVGTRGGTIYKYNVQSGLTRGTFPVNESNSSVTEGKIKDAGDIRRTFRELEKKMKMSNRTSNMDKAEEDRIETAKREARRNTKLRIASHTGHAVTGVAVDSVNKTVISVGEDSKLILWNFSTHTPHKNSPSKLPAPAKKLCHVKNSDLAAIALADFSALLFDCSTLIIVRRFGYGTARHTGPISDLGFSPDGRTLFTSSLDSTIRVWDVPTNTCVDWLGFSTPPTSLAISPTGEFLATTHASRLGISLWSDRSFYQTVHVDGAMDLSEPSRMDDPAPVSEAESNGDDDNDDALKMILKSSSSPESSENRLSDQANQDLAIGPVKSREDGLITLSGLPPAHWKNLFHLELVKQRNKPSEPPKKPPSAPFFLQWRPGIKSTGELTENPESTAKQPAGLDGGGFKNNDAAEWDAVWSDDDDEQDSNENGQGKVPGGLPPLGEEGKKQTRHGDGNETSAAAPLAKKRKVSLYRSELATLLQQCLELNNYDTNSDGRGRFQRVTEYIGGLGPSAIDVSLGTLCNGTHDLEEGIPLLILATKWLIEACKSRERFDAVNAYLHRFLYLHSNILALIEDDEDRTTIGKERNDELPTDEKDNDAVAATNNADRLELISSITKLKETQRNATRMLQEEMENTLCLLRHFSRMV